MWPSASLRDVQQQAQRPRSTMSSIVHHRRDQHDSQDYATQCASKITCSTKLQEQARSRVISMIVQRSTPRARDAQVKHLGDLGKQGLHSL